MRVASYSQAVVLLLVLVGALMLDLYTKHLAQETLRLHQPVAIVGSALRLTLGYNTGMAWSFLADNGRLPTILSGLVLLGLTLWIVKALVRGTLSHRHSIAMGLLLGGGLANFVDRLADGRVTDFLDIGIGASRWPTFNLADVLLTLAIMVLLVNIVRQLSATRRNNDAHR